MAVDAVVGGVERAVLEPFDRDVARVVGRVLDLAERLDPVDALGLLGPEPVRVLDRALVHLLVLGVVDEAALLPLGRNLVNLVGHTFLLVRAQFRAPGRAIALFWVNIMRRRLRQRQGRPPATFVAATVGIARSAANMRRPAPNAGNDVRRNPLPNLMSSRERLPRDGKVDGHGGPKHACGLSPTAPARAPACRRCRAGRGASSIAPTRRPPAR